MTVNEFKKTDMYKGAKEVRFYDAKGVNVSNKPAIILDLIDVIGTSHNADGTIDVDLLYME